MLKRMVLIGLWLAMSGPALAQERSKSIDERGRPEGSVPTFSAAEVRDNWQAVAYAVSLTGQDAAALRIEEAVNALSDADLERVYGEADMVGLIESFNISNQALDAVDQANYPGSRSIREVVAASALTGPAPLMWSTADPDAGGFPLSVGFPDAQGYPGAICPFSPDRSNADNLLIAVDAIQVARIALESAKVLWSGLSRACGETIVAAGFGGNTELACIPADVVLFAAELVVGTAEGVVEHLEFCDAAVDAAEIEGAYERAGHLHLDLSTHDTEIASQLATHDTDISSQLATHDTDISNQLTTHDEDIKDLLADLQGAVDENQRLIKIFMSRQLEVLRLMITPEGNRNINPVVLTCTGDNCPQVLECPDGGLGWPCK